MKKTLLTLAAVAVVMSANAHMTVTRQSATAAPRVSLLEQQSLGLQPRLAKYHAPETQQFNGTRLVNTGIKISDVQSGRVSMEELRLATSTAVRMANTPHSSATWAANAGVLRESMDNFTDGSQESPVAASNSGMQIASKYLSAGVNNLYGYGVYSMGGGMAALMNQANELRIVDIQAATPLKIGFWVGALQQNAGVMLNMIEGDNGTAFLMNSQPTAIPFDGNIYWFETSTNGFKDKNNNPINTKVSLMIMGTNGSADTNLAMCGVWVDGDRFDGSGGGGGQGGGGGTDPGVEIGIPTNIYHNIDANRQGYNVTFTGASNATHHEIYVFNDITGPTTANFLNVDWSPLNAGATDYQNPNLSYFSQDVKLAEIPGGLCHWPVLVNGAIGFGYLHEVVSSTNSWAGFETSDYDLRATNGVATINFEMYPTDWTVFVINEYALNRTTGKYELVDQAELDGSQIQWNAWDQFNVTLDVINSSVYDLEHVYFMFGLVSESQDLSIPSFLYFRKMHISANIPAGKETYYLHANKEQQGTSPFVMKGAVDENNFNYTIRGTYHADNGNAYGEWAAHPTNGGTFYVLQDPEATPQLQLDGGDAEYYDMQGRRIQNPEAGIYIVRRGNKVTKEVIK